MRRILILAPMFFPDPQVGGIRLSQWARHLPEFGWSPLVMTRHSGFTASPEQIANHLHPAVRVEYLGTRSVPQMPTGLIPTRDAPMLRTIAVQLLDAVSIPDVLVWKWRLLADEVITKARQWRPEVVLSSSPSHSIHVAGRRVAKATGVPWIADFRDPYLIDYRHRPRGVKRVLLPWHRRFEERIYQDAALCTHAIPVHARWASRRYPFARHKIRTLTNGVPSELLDQLLADQTKPREALGAGRISIRMIGVLQDSAMHAIASALRQLLSQGVDAEFQHVGYARVDAASIPSYLDGRFQLLGPVRHDEALRAIAGADILLNYLDKERSKVSGLSSKLFEYLATGLPVVAVNPTRPDRQLIHRLPWCWCVQDPCPSALAMVLQQAITSRPRPPDQWLARFRSEYNRREQTYQLVKWLDGLVTANSAAAD